MCVCVHVLTVYSLVGTVILSSYRRWATLSLWNCRQTCTCFDNATQLFQIEGLYWYYYMHMHTHVHTHTTHTHTHTQHTHTHTHTHYSTTGHSGSVTSVKWSEDNQWLLTCSTEKMARVWNSEQKDPVLTIDTVKHNFIKKTEERDSVCFIPTNNYVHNHFIGQCPIQQGGDSRTVLLHGQVYFTDLSKYFIPVQVQYGPR